MKPLAPTAEYTFQTNDIKRLWQSFPIWIRFGGLLQVFAVMLPLLAIVGFLKVPLTFAAFAAYLLVAVFRVVRMTGRVTSSIDAGQAQPTAIQVRQDYLEIESESSLWMRSWQHVEEVVEHTNNLIVVMSKYFRMVIPERAFESAASRQEFLEASRLLIDQADKRNDPIEIPKVILEPFPISVKYETTRWLFTNQQTMVQRQRERTPMGFVEAFMLAVFPIVSGFLVGTLMDGSLLLEGRFLNQLFWFFALVIISYVAQIVFGRLFQVLAFGRETSDKIEITVDVNQQGMEVRNDEQSVFVKWEFLMLGPPLKDRSLAVLMKIGRPVALIPARAFQNESHRQAFAQMIAEQTVQDFQPELVEAQLAPNASAPSRETGNPFQAPTREDDSGPSSFDE